MELTKYQMKMVWSACNLAQSLGLQHMAQLNASKIDIPETWITETKKEHLALQQAKEKLNFWKE